MPSFAVSWGPSVPTDAFVVGSEQVGLISAIGSTALLVSYQSSHDLERCDEECGQHG